MGLVDVAISYSFIRDMTVSFDKTDSFKLGIIDKDGNFLKKKDQLETSAEKKAYPNKLTVLAWNIKKILSKIAIGRSTLGSFVSALYLLREELNNEAGYNMITEKLYQMMRESYPNDRETFINELFESQFLSLPQNQYLIEDAGMVVPTNNVGGGMIKGAAPGEDPPIRVKKKKKIYELMGRYTVFEISPEEFEKCSCAKRKFEKWNKFFDEDSEMASSIKKYSHHNPEKGIILRNSETGQTMMFRRRWSDQRLTHNRKAKLLAQSQNKAFSIWIR
jgi:hypothetical protein